MTQLIEKTVGCVLFLYAFGYYITNQRDGNVPYLL